MQEAGGNSVTRKTIVITGVSRGLGRALVDGFSETGHVVVGCARNETAITDLQKQFETPHRFDVVDVANDSGVTEWVADVINSHGPPDLVINNAALINQNAVLWEVSAPDFSQLFDINVKGTFYVIRAVLPYMIDAGNGVIANLSSGWGRATSPEVAPYCASKWAIEGLTQALAKELPRGLSAVPVNPGVINTDMLQSTFGPTANGYQTAEEWAEKAVPFFLNLGPHENGKPVSVP